MFSPLIIVYTQLLCNIYIEQRFVVATFDVYFWKDYSCSGKKVFNRYFLGLDDNVKNFNWEAFFSEYRNVTLYQKGFCSLFLVSGTHGGAVG
jgi:hypothetical protein